MKTREIRLRIITDTLPDEIGGVSMAPDDSKALTVIINDAKTDDEQALSFLHEMLHIWHDDHHRQGESVEQIEDERCLEMLRLLQLSQNPNSTNIE